MAKRAYPKRYAQAVFEIALEAGELERWQSDLEKIVQAVSDKDFAAFLESPKIHFAEKSKLLSSQMKEVNLLILNLVLLLISRSRLDIIGEIAQEYQRLWNSYRGIELAEVTTAVPLAEEDEQNLARHLGSIVGKKVEIKSEVDPDVIGGFIARIGDQILDGSTRSKLAALKKEMAGAEK
ncbi:MAG: F0F1 ATP synthase subunit delta [Dehalococcoidales bacterium]|nr:F0F1 ATP synthase subunit delta [Dehalococcoidales bacterium]